MALYEDIARVAGEVGWQPDTVIVVAFWCTLILGAIIFGVCLSVIRYAKHIKHRTSCQ